MKYLKFSLVAVAMLAMVVASTQDSVAGLVDGGFEAGPLVDDGNGVGKWNSFTNGGLNSSDSTTTMPRSGLRSLELILGDANGFSGAFQDVAIPAGTPFTFSVWHKETTNQNGAGIEMRVEFVDSTNGNAEISRTANNTPASLGATWEPFSINDVIPAGADTARVVYAIQSFGAGVPQAIFVDDAAVTFVPEPTSIALMGFAGLAIASMRRRK